MIHSYYCVDCGKKSEGGEITFDLAQMLGLDAGFPKKQEKENEADGKQPRMTNSQQTEEDFFSIYISQKELQQYASASNVRLEHKKPVKITITLKDVMELYAQKTDDVSVQQRIREMGIEEIKKADFVLLLAYAGGQNDAVIQSTVSGFGKRLVGLFAEERKEEDDSSKKPDEILKSYKKTILVSPEYLDKTGNALYTLSFTPDTLNDNKMKYFQHARKTVRGYCPYCHAPVLEGTGVYRHIKIGFIGASRAGKTSLIIAMLSELLDNAASDFPEAIELADSRKENLDKQRELYRKGWQIEKSQPQSVEKSFNASVKIRSRKQSDNYVVVTFVDIAGELCLNDEKQFDPSAVDKYPLIACCDLYLLCTCISDEGFRENGGQGGIDNGISAIVEGILKEFNKRDEWFPPLAIVLTKADYANGSMEEAGLAKKNPFKQIVSNTEYFSKGRNMLMRLGKIYDMNQDQEDYVKPLQWCCRLYQNYCDRTYLSMFYCSATGGLAEPYTAVVNQIKDIRQNIDKEGKEVRFTRTHVDTVLSWILQVMGCVPVEACGGYCCYDIPVYGEVFASEEKTVKQAYDLRQIWPWGQMRNRTAAVFKLFMNQSELDRELMGIYREDAEDNQLMRFLKRFGNSTPAKKCLDAVNRYVTQHSKGV